jgi:transposase-like protein
MHRVREMIANNNSRVLKGEVEADEAYFGGKEKNKPTSKKLKLGRGPVGKTPVLGMRERGGNVVGVVVKDTTKKTIQGELNKRIDKDATLYTDEYKSYQGNKFKHKTVNHSAKQYVDGKAHTNSIESYWALLKRGHYGIFHNLSKKHLQRYVDEFAYRLNDGKADQDSMEVINSLLTKSIGKYLPYKRLKGTLTEQIKMENTINIRKALQLKVLQILQENKLLEDKVEDKFAYLKRRNKSINPNMEKSDEDN